MRSEFVSFDSVRDNAIKLAHTIAREWGIPDIIYVSLRGGAAMGNVISEYFKILAGRKKRVLYAAVVARSYTGMGTAGQVIVDGWTYSPEKLRDGQNVLFIDDIFDTGQTLNSLVASILDTGIKREHIKIAVHDYKIRQYLSKPHPVLPDYYCREFVLEKPEDDFWIHYLSHEIESLTGEQRALHYEKGDPEMKAALLYLETNK
ncbi:MAG: phosphoribosyltransferase [Spirochaetales bacterium]|nr:phosphoribosyltransferase [Spirochaetales bacterium]